MANVDVTSSFVDLPVLGASSASGWCPSDAVAPLELDYLRARERAERAAAKNAQSVACRRAHQQLAEAYALLIHQSQTKPR